MATYTPITDAETSHLSPMTVSKERRWRDNPIAIAEGATGAPKIAYKALAGLGLGAVSWSGSGFAGWTGLGGVKDMLIFAAGATADNMRLQFTADNGASWSSVQTSTITTGNPRVITLNLVSGYYEATGGYSGTLTVPANCNGVRISWTTLSGSALAFAIGGR